MGTEIGEEGKWQVWEGKEWKEEDERQRLRAQCIVGL